MLHRRLRGLQREVPFRDLFLHDAHASTYHNRRRRMKSKKEAQRQQLLQHTGNGTSWGRVSESSCRASNISTYHHSG